MKKILIALASLVGLAALQLPVNGVLAAPAIQIFKAETGQEGVSSIAVPKGATKSSWPVYIALSTAPSKPVTLQVRHQGAAVIYWSGSDDLTFDQNNWSRRRRLVLEYQGNAKPGSSGRVIISGSGLPASTILFTVEGVSSGGSSGGGSSSAGGSGGGDSNSSSGGSATKLADNITTDDLKDLGFSQLDVNGIFDRIIQLLLWLIAVGAFLSIIYSGFQYITAGGDASAATKARKNIVWAITGIIIASLSFAAIRLVADIGKNSKLLPAPETANSNNNSKGTSSQSSETFGPTADAQGVSLLVLDPNNFSPSIILFPDATTQTSRIFYLKLSAPAGKVTVKITKTGQLPITISPDSFSFDDQNWDRPQQFAISYTGNGQSGQTATVLIKASTGASYVIKVGVP